MIIYPLKINDYKYIAIQGTIKAPGMTFYEAIVKCLQYIEANERVKAIDRYSILYGPK